MATLAILFFIISYLTFGEVLLEFRAHKRGWETILFGPVKPTQTASSPNPDAGYGPTAAFPFRSLVIPVPRKEGTKRLWIASSSYGVASNLPAPQIFPNRIPNMLDEQGIRSEVINASRIGAIIGANNVELRQLGATWRPDYAVLYELSNDVTALSKRFLTISTGNGRATADRQRTASPATFQKLGRFLENTTVYAHLQAEIRARVARNGILFDGIGPKAEDEFKSSLRDFVGSCRIMKIKPVLCTFAVSHNGESFGKWPSEVKNALFRYNVSLSTKGWASTIDRFNSIIRSVAIDNHSILVDIDSAVGGRRQYFSDFAHFTPAGHERVARLLADAIAEDIKKPTLTGQR